jgi:thiamine-phosphate pyrophosphorylase
MPTIPLPDGLYAITDSVCTPAATLCTRVERAIAGGARMIQYRDKQATDAERHARTPALVAMCRAHGIPLLVNDDIELAAACAADGVHLGEHDASIQLARARLGPQALIGVSCYDRLERALQAQAEGASYVAFGRFFPSHSKPGARTAPVELLRAARRRLTLPIVAIGGITPDNGAELVRAGANLLAAIHGVFCTADPCAAARRYSRLFAALPRNPARDFPGS